MSSAKTVILKQAIQIRKEAVSSAIVTPGFLLELESAGTVKAHSSAAGHFQKMFAVEDELQGKDIDDNYASGARVAYNVLRTGDIINAILDDGETVVIGDFVESAGNGKVQKFTTGTILGLAVEAVDMSASDADDPSDRINIEIV